MAQHIVYAVCETPLGPHKVPVSGAKAWHAAIARWYALDDRRTIDRAPLNVRGCAVRYFAVRSADDPGWPAPHGPIRNRAARFQPRETTTGRWT